MKHLQVLVIRATVTDFVASGSGTSTQFAYPGMSYDTTGAYPPYAAVNWWESPANKEDKRGLHSAGPFSLAPGALNFVTTGVVWERDLINNDLFRIRREGDHRG